jgi:excisionase family DNA binding protein
MEALLISVKDAAEIIGVKKRHVYYLAEFGYLEAFKIRGIWRFYKGAVYRYAGSTDARRVNKKPSRNNDNRGCIASLRMLPLDDQGLDFGWDLACVPSGRGSHEVANKQGRRSKTTVKVVKSVGSVGQIEFDFGVAV